MVSSAGKAGVVVGGGTESVDSETTPGVSTCVPAGGGEAVHAAATAQMKRAKQIAIRKRILTIRGLMIQAEFISRHFKDPIGGWYK